MTCGIYIIYNNFNDRVYIGQSLNVEDRWTRHVRELAKNKHHSYKLQKEYTSNSFFHEILVTCIPADLSSTEITYITEFEAYYKGYNCTTGLGVTGTGYDSAGALYTKSVYIKIVQYLAYSSISQKDLARELGVSENVVHNISTLRRHGWIQHEMPLEYDILQNKYLATNVRPRGSNPDIEKVFKDLIYTRDSLDVIQSKYSLSKKQIEHLLYGGCYKWLDTLYPIEYSLLSKLRHKK